MTPEEARERFASARVARLATADAEGVPHIVPLVFALDGETIYSAVDAKPKRTTDLKRLRNVTAKTVDKEPKWRKTGRELTTGYRPNW